MFARYGINNENLTDINNPDLAKMLTIMADQNIQPTAIIERLNIKQTSDFNSPGAVQNFRDNLALYNFTKTKFPALSIENSFIYEEANKLTPNGKADDKVLGTKLNNLAGDAKNYKVNLQNIETNLAANAPLVFDQFVGIVDKLDVNVDSNFFYKLATGKENPYVVAIPSYQRPECLKNKTLKLLKKYKIKKEYIDIFVANQQEKVLYEKKCLFGLNLRCVTIPLYIQVSIFPLKLF